MDDELTLDIAANLARSFNAPVERIELYNNDLINYFTYPRVIEKIFPKTEEEIAESEAIVSFITSQGLLDDRPLSFLEIVEKLKELGYNITKEENK